MKSFISPAKLNLFFRVLRKREDGYHEIASLFQAIDLFDRLFFSFSPDDELTCSDPFISCDKTNLVAKALQIFRNRFGCPPMKIHIEKVIPIQAGLGGGSSNAATTLYALNELNGSPANREELIEMGAQIGSDVPFFFSNGTAYCTGRGEMMEPFELFSPLSGWVAKPFYGLSTPLVFGQARPKEFIQREPREALKHYPTFFNDLEIPAFQIEPRLIALKSELLEEGFSQVVMTGSGTAFFCLGGEPKPIEGVQFYPFSSINRSDSWYEKSDER